MKKDGSVRLLFTLIHRNLQADVNGNRRNLLFYSWFNKLNKVCTYIFCYCSTKKIVIQKGVLLTRMASGPLKLR